ncbi:MAG TPA: hypothetical protein VN606_03365 [Thermoleophilaceae bacterium]|nr:hypothetical protein [Thermoleophilaceae bacterium]
MDATARHERLYREHADAVYSYALRRTPRPRRTWWRRGRIDQYLKANCR